MILLVDPEKFVHDLVERRRGELGLTHVHRMSDLAATLAEADGRSKVVIFGPGCEPSEVLEQTSGLQREHPDLGVVLISAEATPELLRHALRTGVGDVLDYPFSFAEFDAAIDRARNAAASRQDLAPEPSSTPRAEATDPPENGAKVITVFSTKGGSGKSFVATNLAALLARRQDGEVALVDLDLQAGDAAVMLQLVPEWTIRDVSENLERLDADIVDGYVVRHETGLRLLAAPHEPADAEAIRPEAVPALLDALGHRHRYVVVDSPANFDDHVLGALDRSDRCVLVGSLDVPSLKNLKIALVTLQRLGVERDRIDIVLNRSDSDVGLSPADVEDALETSIDFSIPSSAEVPRSINHGRPIALRERRRRNGVARALDDLAGAVLNGDAPTRNEEPTETKGSLLGRLLGRSDDERGDEDGSVRQARTQPA